MEDNLFEPGNIVVSLVSGTIWRLEHQLESGGLIINKIEVVKCLGARQ